MTGHVLRTSSCVPTANVSHYNCVATKKTTAEMAPMNNNAPSQLVHLATSCAQLPVPAFHNDGSVMGTMIVGMALMSTQHSAGLNQPIHVVAKNSRVATATAYTSHENVTGTKTALMALMRLSRNVVGWPSLIR